MSAWNDTAEKKNGGVGGGGGCVDGSGQMRRAWSGERRKSADGRRREGIACEEAEERAKERRSSFLSFRAFLERGGGVSVLHYGLNNNPPQPNFLRRNPNKCGVSAPRFPLERASECDAPRHTKQAVGWRVVWEEESRTGDGLQRTNVECSGVKG